MVTVCAFPAMKVGAPGGEACPPAQGWGWGEGRWGGGGEEGGRIWEKGRTGWEGQVGWISLLPLVDMGSLGIPGVRLGEPEPHVCQCPAGQKLLESRPSRLWPAFCMPPPSIGGGRDHLSTALVNIHHIWLSTSAGMLNNSLVDKMLLHLWGSGGQGGHLSARLREGVGGGGGGSWKGSLPRGKSSGWLVSWGVGKKTGGLSGCLADCRGDHLSFRSPSPLFVQEGRGSSLISFCRANCDLGWGLFVVWGLKCCCNGGWSETMKVRG